MAKASINIQPVKAGSEEHNLRLKPYDYVRQDLSHLNGSYIKERISPALERIKNNYQKSTGQKMQKKSTPIREGVVLIKQEHTPDDLVKLGKKLEDRFGIKLIQAFTHKDEGHWKEGVWTPNLHGHMVFDWTDEKGKSIKLNRYQMSEMQTIVAETLDMERGISSDKNHLSAIAFKVQEEEKRLQEIKTTLNVDESQFIEYKKGGFLSDLIGSKEIDTTLTISNYKKALQSAKINLKEKEKELNLSQKLSLSLQKEIENLKKRQKKLEKDIDSSTKLQLELLSNRSFYKSMREMLREDFLQHLMKAYQSEMKKVFMDYYQKHHTILIASPSFHEYRNILLERLCKDLDIIDDMKTEILEIFEKELKEKNLHLQMQKEIIKSLKEKPIEEEHNIQKKGRKL